MAGKTSVSTRLHHIDFSGGILVEPPVDYFETKENLRVGKKRFLAFGLAKELAGGGVQAQLRRKFTAATIREPVAADIGKDHAV